MMSACIETYPNLSLVAWCLMALSSQKGYIMPCENEKCVKDNTFRHEFKMLFWVIVKM